MELPRVVLFVDYSNAFYRQFLRGVIKYANLHGSWHCYRRSQITDSIFREVKDWNASGVIAQINTPRQAKRLLELNVPLVLIIGIDSPQIEKQENVISIFANEAEIGKIAGEYFLEKKYHQFAYCSRGNAPWSSKRGKAFADFIAEAGYDTNIYSKPDLEKIRSVHREEEYLLDWVRSLPKPVALLACDDRRAEQMIEISKMADYHVPDDVAVLGVDNDDLICEFSMPTLSSISLNARKAGYESAEALAKLMNGGKIEDRQILVNPVYISSRKSTDIMAIGNQDVIRALRYIREHAGDLIQISDVVDAAYLSRRSLERQFKREIGRTILQEIRRTKADYIAELLIRTNKSVLEISRMLGYSGMENLSRYFKQEKGVSPTEYRKKHGGG